MPIQVLCPGCKKRFSVSDKFAGKKGPCPSCKAEITVPEKGEEVVVHAPEYGPKDSKGRVVLKPIRRSETRLGPLAIVGIAAAVLGVFGLAWLLRVQYPERDVPPAILFLGAFFLGPPLALAGYSFLRDDELEPYRGTSQWIRVGICGIIYGLLWGVYALVPWVLLDGTTAELELMQLLFIVPPIVALGAVAPLATLDLDYGTGLLHYGLYLLVTLILCLIIDVPLFA